MTQEREAENSLRSNSQHLAPTTLSLAGINPPDHMDGTAFLGEYLRSEEPEYIYAAADRFDAIYDQNRAVKDKRFKYIKYYQTDKPMILRVAYREQMPIMQELLRLRDQGQLTEAQAQWFRQSKAEEELFDTEADPHEIHNLADSRDPRHRAALVAMRAALDSWIVETGDRGEFAEPRDVVAPFEKEMHDWFGTPEWHKKPE